MGSDGRTRTGDTTIMSRLLYRLSYTAICAVLRRCGPALDSGAQSAESVTTGNPASPLTESNR